MSKKQVTVIGGGTGSHTILKGLKQYSHQIDIKAVISMSDSGGSTGRLRDEFGQLPVGDVRMALSALAGNTTNDENLLRELFLYRFAKGEGLNGHNFGNLFLTALTDILGSETVAVEAAGRILRISGAVIPVTSDNVHLKATYDDGVVVVGEHKIDEPTVDRYGHRIVELTTDVVGTINSEAKAALEKSDLVILGPGDLYSSLLSNLVIKGVSEAINTNRTPVLYVVNLMERRGQTEKMSVSDCVNEIEVYLGKAPEFVLVNDTPLPAKLVKHYAVTEKVSPVTDDAELLLGQIIRADLLSEEKVRIDASDKVRRSLIRHDARKLAEAVVALVL